MGAQVLGWVLWLCWWKGVGAMGVAGTTGFLEVWVEVLEKLDGIFQCLLKVFGALMLSRFWVFLERL